MILITSFIMIYAGLELVVHSGKNQILLTVFVNENTFKLLIIMYFNVP